MNKAQLKIFALGFLIILLFGGLVFSLSVWHESPADRAFDFDGANITLVCNSTPTPGYNVTNIRLWHNASGTFKLNETRNLTATANISRGAIFVLNVSAYGDHSGFTWNCNGTVVGERSSQIPVTRYLQTFTNNNSNYQVLQFAPIDANEEVYGTYFNGTGQLLVSGADYTIDRAIGNISINLTNLSAIHGGWNITYNVTPNITGSFNVSPAGKGNRSVLVEFTPVVVLNGPADATNNSGGEVTFNISVNSSLSGPSNTTECQLYTNETNQSNNFFFAVKTVLVTGLNNAPAILSQTFQYTFGNDGTFLWNIRCREADNQDIFAYAVANRTIRVSSSLPVITIDSPVNNTFNTTVTIRYTANHTNLNNCSLHHNLNGTYKLNVTNSSLTSGTQSNFILPAPDSRQFIYRIQCWDVAGNTFNTQNLTATIDNLAPQYNWSSFIMQQTCDKVRFQINTTESTNASFQWLYNGTYSSANNKTAFTAGVATYDLWPVLRRQQILWNATVCDEAGNCNSSTAGTYVNMTDPLCTGWNAYAIFDHTINLSLLVNQSEADYVYFYNASNQSWVGHTRGASAYADFLIGWNRGITALWLYKSGNSTWNRNITVQPLVTLRVNLTNISTGGDNFVGIPANYTFGTLKNAFTNETVGNMLNGSGVNATPINYAVYNNTDKRWINAVFAAKFNNATNIPAGDVLWVYARHNMTWNSSTIYAQNRTT